MVLVFRHEAGHAAGALLFDEARITSFSILPRISEQGALIRPHVRVAGSTSAMTRFAPYLLHVAGFLIFLPICLATLRLRRWIWLNLVILGLFLPLLDTLGNYAVGLVRARSDVGRLLGAWPDGWVHLYFLGTIAFYQYGSYRVLETRALTGERG